MIFLLFCSQTLGEVLNILDLPPSSYIFERLEWREGETKCVLPAVEEWVKNPFEAVEWVEEFENQTPSFCVKKGLEILEIKPPGIPEKKKPLEELISLIEKIDMDIKNITLSIPANKLKKLLYKLPLLWVDDTLDAWVKGVLCENPDTLRWDEDSVFFYMGKINWRGMVRDGVELFFFLMENGEGLKKSLPGTLTIIPFSSGTLVLGTPGADVYENAGFVIDPGGDDVYRGRCGGGVLHAGFVLDFGGNDYYEGKIVSLGAGLLGCGVLIDLGGDDVYCAGPYSLGCGYGGCGILYDREGNDSYRGYVMGVGAGNFGEGVLIDEGGNDIYSIYSWGEGFGGSLGCGILYDKRGSDVYHAGGRYYHRPLHPSSFRSFAQGFAIGERPGYGGGAGILYDGEGNDFYNAQIYAQGCAYWFSCGILYDGKGEDHYVATEYAQGAGIHLACGILVDREGNDLYFSRYGPSLGEGHDLSCGILLDGEGDDWYCVSGGIGVGINNSFGFLHDAGGDDVYAVTEELGVGDVNWGRKFASLGVFVDDGGKDYYLNSPGRDDRGWVQKGYGIGVDRNSEKKEEKRQRPVPDFSKMTTEEVFEIASEWGVGENEKRVKAAREELAKRDDVLDYIFKNKMDTESGLDLRAIKAVFEKKGKECYPGLYRALRGKKEEVKNALYLIGELEFKEFEDTLLSMLDRKEYTRYVISALGKIHSKKAVGRIKEYLKKGEERVKVVAALALGRIKDPEGLSSLLDALSSPSLIVRSACEHALGEFGKDALEEIEKRLKRRENVIYLLRVLGNIGDGKEDPEVKALIYPFLEDKDPRIRLFAVRALVRCGGEDVKEVLRIMKGKETDPWVRGEIERYFEK